MNNNFGGIDKGKLMNMLSGSGNQKLADALKTGNLDSVLAAMNPNDAEKVKKVLGNNAAMQKILSSPEAAEIMKKLK